ncbi:MAG: hypothetical protein RR304_03980 [Bacteroides sp.]
MNNPLPKDDESFDGSWAILCRELGNPLPKAILLPRSQKVRARPPCLYRPAD